MAFLSNWINRVSMRTGLVISIVTMGYLAMLLVFISGEVHQRNVAEYQRRAFEELVALKVADVTRMMERRSRELALAAMDEQFFLGAFINFDREEVSRILDNLYTHYLVSSGRVDVKKVYAFGNDRSPLGVSKEGVAGDRLSPDLCPGLLSALAGRKTGPASAQSLSALCTYKRYPYFVTVVGLGAQQPLGFIEIVIDPLPHFVATQDDLGLPVKLRLADNTVIYRSSDWPENGSTTEFMYLDHALTGSDGRPVLTLSVAKNIKPFFKSLSETNYTIMVIAAAVTVIAIVVSLMVLQKTAIEPLQALTLQLRKVRRDRGQLGKQVHVTGNSEVYELGEGFNEMTSQLRELYESLEHMAFTDPLTKLPNRALFHDRLEQAILNARRTGARFALLIMDLDRFKEINDTLGHHVGDTILQLVGSRLTHRLRDSDTVARLGGDEFAILLPAADAKAGIQAARSLLDEFGRPFDLDGQHFYIGASVGIAVFPEHGDSKNILLQRADVAMYAAKNANAGFMVYDAELDRHSPHQLELMGELRQAVVAEDFLLHFQPKIDMRGGGLDGVEVLTRWSRIGDAITPPDVFIPILEQTGQIRSLTRWVLRQALCQCRDWRRAGHDIRMAVNLSARDLQDGNLANLVSNLLNEIDIPARFLELEITESAMMMDPLRSRETLLRLAAVGVGVTIDDFGTGYSSLAYLKRLPAKAIKIDKSFVIGMATDPNDAAIVQSSIDLAHNLGLKVVAEGVEAQESYELLKQYGCDSAQGFHIGRPLPAAAFQRWLKSADRMVVRNGVASSD